LAYNFNNPVQTGSGIRDQGSEIRNPESGSPSPDPGSPIPAPVTSDRPESAANVRFHSCRWMQPAENGNTAFCTHREVKPYAGMAGFDAEAWCPECAHYKLRRSPKKRKPEDYSY